MRRFTYLSVLIVLLTGFLFYTGCESVPSLAPSGSSIVLIANPETVEVDVGVSIITAIVTDPDGQPVSNGTLIYFSTSLGRLEHQSMETVNGICNNTFYAGNITGEALIRAHSGGAGSSDVIVRVGNKPAEIMVLTANPSTLREYETSKISCTLWGENNQPVPNQPVQFTATNGTLHSGGVIMYTNENGQVFDYVFADGYYEGKDPYITVTAYSGSLSASVKIDVIE